MCHSLYINLQLVNNSISPNVYASLYVTTSNRITHNNLVVYFGSV